MKQIRQFLHWIITPYHGSNRISHWVQKHIDSLSLQELIGIPLTGLAFFGAVIVPQTQAGFYNTELYFDNSKNITNVAVSDTTFRWPLSTFGISQNFSEIHPGMDLTDPNGTPIYPISDGTIVYAGSTLFGYGNHVIIKHNDQLQTLYAHLSTILVKEGQKVTKSTELGGVGATGWATGNHLHFEIYINSAATNPLEVLPALKKQE